MNNRDLSSEDVVVEGPDGLREELARLFELRQNNAPAFLEKQHYIIYTLNEQVSLIRVDVSEQPFQFWYGDLQRRKATQAVTDVINNFLNEKFPKDLARLHTLEALREDSSLVDLYELYWKEELLAASIAGRSTYLPPLSMQEAHDVLSRLQRPVLKSKNVPDLEAPAVSVKQSWFGLFSKPAQTSGTSSADSSQEKVKKIP